ncbi:MAG: hypothetical protein HQ498_03740 [Pseudohongiella sp.]|nr:hypothetical protein [Pseudohongiella sp.]
MKIPHWPILPASLIIASSLISAPAMAASVKNISHRVDASNLESVEFDISVGEIVIEVYDGEEIQLEIRLEAQRSWFSLRKRNIEDIELEVGGSGTRVFLGIDERNIEQNWRVMLPAKLAVDLNVGVGDIRIEEFSNNLQMEVGVGAVRVEVNGTDYAEIRLSAGVGDTSIRGFDNHTDNERSFVSAESYYHGKGELEMEMDIEVGVGDVEVINR